MIGFNYRLFNNKNRTAYDHPFTFKSRREFNITMIAAPVSLNTANQSVSQPGNIRTNAANFIIKENQIFCLIIANAFLLNLTVCGIFSRLSAIKTISAVSIAEIGRASSRDRV